MGKSRNKQGAAWLLTALGVLCAGPALAQEDAGTVDHGEDTQIPGLQINGMEVEGASVSLKSLFKPGVTSIDVVHRTNLSHCKLYNLENASTSTDGADTEADAGGDDAGGTVTHDTGSTSGGTNACGLDPKQSGTLVVSWSGDFSNSLATVWSAKIGSCAKAKVGEETTDCKMLTDGVKNISGSGPYEFELPLAKAIGTLRPSDPAGTARKCCDDITDLEETIKVWIFVGIDEVDTIDVLYDAVEFAYDFDPPGTPQGVTVKSTGETLDVSWSKLGGEPEDEVDYQVYWSLEPFTTRSTVPSGGSKTVAGTKSSTKLTDLGTGETYYVSVGARDLFENEGALSANATATTIETDDGFEYYKRQGGGEEGGFCFVATAAYGSYMDPHVEVLRAFRDRLLLPTAPGRSFVRFYYAHGPAWAGAIQGSEAARTAARLALLPLVVLAWFLVVLSGPGKLLVMMLVWAAWRLVREMLRRRYPVPPLARELWRKSA